jgi:malate dehydrogenase (oxaloacetate-decarboxylating)(NADP+)
MDTKVNKEATDNQSSIQPGNIEVNQGKSANSSLDLGIASGSVLTEPCREIAETPSNVYKYTTKGNLVAIVTNGTAITGLGDLGALASKPIMERTAMLMKKYAGIDAFDIELNTTDIDVFVRTVITMSPTFGAINLEYIKAPECFEIEKRLIDALDIPVMHDDQHGTAVVSAAGLLNACEIAGKKPENLKLVVNGDGAAAMACADTYISLGVRKEHIIMIDDKGVISTNRIDLDKYQQQFAINTNIKTLEQSLEGADVFIGLSKSSMLSLGMVHLMAESPIVFALVNPNPEIACNDAFKAKYGIIYATRRSDISNQIDNALVFPYIFRAALDVRASAINTEMKKAAVYALASLAKEPYLSIDPGKNLSFGRDYFIPKTSDYRLIKTITPAVAKAAIESGVAKLTIDDFGVYAKELDKRISK